MTHNATLSDHKFRAEGSRWRGVVGTIRIYVGGFCPTKRTMCVVCRPGSTPPCQRRRIASNISPGLLDSLPNFSDSTTAERSARAATRCLPSSLVALGRTARSLPPWCQTNLVLPAGSGSFGSAAALFGKRPKAEPIPRLLPTSCTGRSLAPYCCALAGRSLAASGILRARPTFFDCLAGLRPSE